MNILCFKSNLGWITIREYKSKIQSIKFDKQKNTGKYKNLYTLKDQILKFCEGRKKNISTKIELTGTSLQKKIWYELTKIPYGSTVSYGDIAKKIKTSPRVVGNVCGKNQHLLIIPCHRVIKSDGKLGGFSSSGGIKLKNKLLTLEKSNV